MRNATMAASAIHVPERPRGILRVGPGGDALRIARRCWATPIGRLQRAPPSAELADHESAGSVCRMACSSSSSASSYSMIASVKPPPGRPLTASLAALPVSSAPPGPPFAWPGVPTPAVAAPQEDVDRAIEGEGMVCGWGFRGAESAVEDTAETGHAGAVVDAACVAARNRSMRAWSAAGSIALAGLRHQSRYANHSVARHEGGVASAAAVRTPDSKMA